MTRNDLISTVAKATKGTKVNVANTLKAIETAITNELKAQGSVQLTGFLSFKSKIRKGKSGKVAGKAYTTQDKLVVNVKVGKILADAVAGK
jgi:nucleoid DNA-binding protein